MTVQERCDLILAFSRVLYSNGQATDQVLAAAKRLGRALGLRVELLPSWGALLLRADDGCNQLISVVAAKPTGVDMDRVAAALRAIDGLSDGRLGPAAAATEITAIAARPPVAAWLFSLAAAAGAVALAFIFGIQHPASAALIAVSAGAGAVLRRGIARYSSNLLLQPFAAALLAGLVGALAVHYGLGSSLRLVAICPCMILVPGPHVLNGMLDLIEGRMGLGIDRLVYAGLITAAISIGLLLGLAFLGVSLPIDEPGVPVPLWRDVVAAGVAVAAYSVFFSTPPAMFAWPVAIGMLAHALRWWALSALGASAASGSLFACLVVGSILTPVARRWHMPFAAIGFAAVVSMIPGVFVFRMASGLVELTHAAAADPALLRATIANGVEAMTIVFAISAGLLLPRLTIDRIAELRGKRSLS